MKKLIAVSAVAALAATALSAEITFGAWLRALAAPVASDGKDTVTAAGNSWGWGARTARLNVNGKSEDGTAGFSMGIYNDVTMGKLDSGDEANLWIKPHDMVKVSYGKYDNNTLRGDCCYGSWNWLRPTSSWIAEDEGLLMSGNGGTGLLFEITPMENLYIQALAPITTTQTKADATYKQLRGGFAYTIPGTAKIKAQYIGKGKGSVDKKDATPAYIEFMRQRIYASEAMNAAALKEATKEGKEFDGWTYHDAEEAVKKADGNSDCTFEAEVDVLAVENLFLGLGIQYNNIKDADKSAKIDNQMKIALGATYQVNDDLKVSASGAFFTYYKTNDVKTDSRFQAGAGVDYNLGDGLSANADFRYLSKFGIDGEKADNTDSIAFSAGIQKGFSNGYIGVAFQGQTNSGTFANNVITGATNDDGKYKNFVWAIPVALSVWF